MAMLGCGGATDGSVAPAADASRSGSTTAAESEVPRFATMSGGATSQAPEPLSEIDRQIASIPDAQQTELIGPHAVGAIATCAVCHGANGEGNPALDAPRISGLGAWYVARQLDNFRSGVRGSSDEDRYGTQMRAIALTLEDDEAIADLAAYLAELQSPYAPATVSGDVEHGADLYATCTACHGMDGRGSVQLSTPSLIGQYDWYLVRQLELFRSGLRGTHPQDVYGAQMRPIVMATLTSRGDIVDVVAYIQSLSSATGGAAGARDAADPAPAESESGDADIE
jgi:cytochrome c553